MAVEWSRIAYDDEILNKEFTINEKSDNYSILTSEFGECFVLTGSTDKTFTLPNASAIWQYKRIRCAISGTATLTIQPYSGGTINGKAKLESTHQYAWVELVLTGANTWMIYSSSKKNLPINYSSWILKTSSGYQFSKTITIDHNKVSGSSNHSNFPVLIKEISQDFLKTRANGGNIENSNGYDIIFTSDSGGETQLDHEIQRYNGTSGDFIAWVRIPTLDYNDNTVLYMHYGNSSISSSQEDVDGTWESNFKGVWHLKEQGDGTASEYIDSSGNSNHGQGGAGTSGYVPEKYKSMIDYGQLYDGEDDQIDCKSGSTLDQLSSLTFSCWIKRTRVDQTNPRLFEKRATAAEGKVFFLYDGLRPRFSVKTDTPDEVYKETSVELDDNVAYHVAVTWDGTLNASGINLYVNGSLGAVEGSAGGTGNIIDDSGGNFWLFSRDANDRTFLGVVGEVHISESVRSADWILTEYNNQVDPKSFYTVS